MTDRLAELGALQYAVENLSTAGTNPNRLGLAGYIHAAYIEYQVWAAANPGVNPDRLGARGRLYGYFYDYGFSPLNLFSAGEVGAWYDPSDLSTMFQDSAGTTPVTADGQPVGKILDKSGRGNHASQATAASRPLYKTDGTYHWLQFDGVDDSLSTAAIDFTSTDKMFVCAGSVSAPYVASSVFLELGPTYDSTFPAFLIRGCHTASNYLFCSFQDTTGYVTANTLPINLGNVKTIQTRQMNPSALTVGGKQKVSRVNAVEYAIPDVSPIADGGNWVNAPLNIGRRNNASAPFTGNIYSLIIRADLSTTQEITDTETWVNGKTGAWA